MFNLLEVIKTKRNITNNNPSSSSPSYNLNSNFNDYLKNAIVPDNPVDFSFSHVTENDIIRVVKQLYPTHS